MAVNMARNFVSKYNINIQTAFTHVDHFCVNITNIPTQIPYESVFDNFHVQRICKLVNPVLWPAQSNTLLTSITIYALSEAFEGR